MYENLFSPITINKLEIKNRIAYPALGILYSYDRKLNNRYYNYFKEKASGGAGIVTVGPVGIDFIGSGFIALSIAEDEAIPDFKKLTKIIRDNGASPWIQLFHAGAYSHPILIDNKTPIAPSPVYTKYSKVTPRQMTLEDIHEVQNAFKKAALRAKEAGFDGVEIIGSAGYLITQFVSPLRNIREDEYGGNFENRTRFPKELIQGMRKTLGNDYPVTIRMSGNDFVKGSNTDAETSKIAKVYEKAGVDAINVTGGWHETKVPQLPMDMPRSAFAYLAYNIKKTVSVPVFASNRIADPKSAEKIIRDGFADMVNLGRVLIADPKWPQKALNGKADEIRPCVACSQGCTDQVFNGKPVFCVGNPRASFEGERNIVKTDSPKNVMVIGAGIAGLEAAVTAAGAGHKVKIYEKADDIGGQIWLAGAPPHKQELLEFVRYYRAMIKKYNIPLFFYIDVDKAFILKKNPDHLIIAEGAKALLPPIKGVDSPNVLSAWDVLADKIRLEKSIAIIGGGAAGLETAMFVANKGTIDSDTLYFLLTYEAQSVDRLKELMFQGSCKVTVFEMLPKSGSDVGKSTRWVLFDNLRRYGVKVITGAKVTSIDQGIVIFEKDNNEEKMSFDQVILASGSKSVQKISTEAKTLKIPFSVAGDCICPGKIDNAIHGGFIAAIKI